MNKQKLFEMFADLIYDYKCAEESLIWETSYNIERAKTKLGREVAERIENFKAELNSSEWIPCSERLPELRKDCLVTVKYSGFMGMHGIWIKTGHMEKEGVWQGDCCGGEVIAWMPLPPAFKGE